MTDTELVAAIRKIVTARVRDKGSAEVRDLARYDQIAGLVLRHPVAKAAKATAPLLRVAETARTS